MKVLVTGSTGLLGRPVVAAFRLRAGTDVVGLSHGELDITDGPRVDAQLPILRPDLVVHCAAYTRVDDCEAHEAEALRVNAEGAGNVARAAARCGARLIHISTDYVFEAPPGVPIAEEHPPADPARLSAYGRSKLMGERLVRQCHPRAIVVRTAWLFGPDGRCFPTAILEQARAGRSLRVVDDQIGSPTYAPDLAEALCDLAEALAGRPEPPGDRAAGVFHITNAGGCSWYEFAREIVRQAGLPARIEPVSTAGAARPARRPAWSVLDTGRFEKTTGRRLRPWQEALRAFLS